MQEEIEFLCPQIRQKYNHNNLFNWRVGKKSKHIEPT